MAAPRHGPSKPEPNRWAACRRQTVHHTMCATLLKQCDGCESNVLVRLLLASPDACCRGVARCNNGFNFRVIKSKRGVAERILLWRLLPCLQAHFLVVCVNKLPGGRRVTAANPWWIGRLRGYQVERTLCPMGSEHC